jgi:hypothetical protein
MSCLFLVNIALLFMRSVRMTTTQSCENHEKIKRAAAGSCAQPAAAFYRSNLRNRGATGLGRGADDERAASASEPLSIAAGGHGRGNIFGASAGSQDVAL